MDSANILEYFLLLLAMFSLFGFHLHKSDTPLFTVSENSPYLYSNPLGMIYTILLGRLPYYFRCISAHDTQWTSGSVCKIHPEMDFATRTDAHSTPPSQEPPEGNARSSVCVCWGFMS